MTVGYLAHSFDLLNVRDLDLADFGDHTVEESAARPTDRKRVTRVGGVVLDR